MGVVSVLTRRTIRGVIVAVLYVFVLVFLIGSFSIVQKYLPDNGTEVATTANHTLPTMTENSSTVADRADAMDPEVPHLDSVPSHDMMRNISIVVQLSGEMGNHLSKIAFAKAVQLRAKELYGIQNTQLIFRAQKRSKSANAILNTKECFPTMRPFDFREANTEEFNLAVDTQKEWLGEQNASELFLEYDCMGFSCIDQSLHYLQTLLKTRSNPRNVVQTNANVSLPFIYSQQYSNDAWVTMDKNYDELRKLFVFDEEACCKLRPDPDESVFHFRNFRVEMPRKWNKLGFVELSPNKTANELFGHLNPGDKVAITTRVVTPHVQEYVSALEQRGLAVRLVEGQTPLQDFCFLRSAQKELVGTTLSTYVVWAGYLGNAKNVRLYTVDSPSRREIHGDALFFHYNWINAELKTRIKFELYKSEELDNVRTEGLNTSTASSLHVMK